MRLLGIETDPHQGKDLTILGWDCYYKGHELGL